MSAQTEQRSLPGHQNRNVIEQTTSDNPSRLGNSANVILSGKTQTTLASIFAKMFLNEALERGLTKNVAHKSRRFKAPSEQVSNIHLSLKEMDDLKKLIISGTIFYQ